MAATLYPTTTLTLFPTLNPGWSVIRRPIAGKTLVATAGTGREVRARLWAYPMWEWDLTWEYLPDAQANGVTASDFKTLLGTLLAEADDYGGFQYVDQDENAVVGQAIGWGDGVTTRFTILKTFGGLAYGYGYEPIGVLTKNGAAKVYLNGALQPRSLQGDPLTYTFDLTAAYAQAIVFNTPPAAGVAITADISFSYYVHFKDQVTDWDNFAWLLWSQSKITLESLRP